VPDISQGSVETIQT